MSYFKMLQLQRLYSTDDRCVNEYRVLVEMILTEENLKHLKKNLSQYPLCLSQIPSRLAWYSTWASADMLTA